MKFLKVLHLEKGSLRKKWAIYINKSLKPIYYQTMDANVMSMLVTRAFTKFSKNHPFLIHKSEKWVELFFHDWTSEMPGRKNERQLRFYFLLFLQVRSFTKSRKYFRARESIQG